MTEKRDLFNKVILGHGDINPLAPKPPPVFLDKVIAKGNKKIQEGIDYIKENPQKIAVSAVRLAGKTAGVVGDILLNTKEAGAGSDKVPMKTVDSTIKKELLR